jgi:hypothetical protein
MSFLTTVFLVVGAATVLAIWVAYQRKPNTNADAKAKAKAPSATERFRSHHEDEDEDEDKDKDNEKCTPSSDDDDDDDDDDESSVSSDSDADSDADSECIGSKFKTTDDTEAECGNSSARRRVVDAFIAVVGRSPTPREICVYVHPDLAAASTADLRRAIKKDYARAPAKKSKPTAAASSSADPEPYSTTTALAVSSVRQEPDRSGSYKKPKSILVQRADMLKRLDNILSEVEQFRQFIQMM